MHAYAVESLLTQSDTLHPARCRDCAAEWAGRSISLWLCPLQEAWLTARGLRIAEEALVRFHPQPPRLDIHRQGSSMPLQLRIATGSRSVLGNVPCRVQAHPDENPEGPYLRLHHIHPRPVHVLH